MVTFVLPVYPVRTSPDAREDVAMQEAHQERRTIRQRQDTMEKEVPCYHQYHVQAVGRKMVSQARVEPAVS